MNETIKFPFYARLAFVLISLIAIFSILYIGQGIIVPVLFAFLFAILLEPICRFLKRKLHFPHVIACLVSVALFIAFFVALFSFLSWQIGDMINDWAKIKHNVGIHINHLQELVRSNFNVSKREQNEFLDSATSDSGTQLVTNTLFSVTDLLLNVTLVPIYIFLILLYKNHLIKFLSKLYSKDHHATLQEILGQVKISIQSYIIGLFIEMLIVSILTGGGYMIIGVKYAILLGVISGLLNLIPYIGILFAIALSIAATLGTSTDISMILYILLVNGVVQFIDNNFLVPMIVSSKVEINAIVAIIGIIVGGTIAGVGGMFLTIPLLAVLKVIFDRVDGLHPWGYLMGDDIPKTFRWHSMRLPLFNNDQVSTTISADTPPEAVTFTPTSTLENNPEP